MSLHLAVALEGTGWHPASWRSPQAQPDRLLTPGYWLELVQEAERGLLDLVTFEDGLSLQSTQYHAPDARTDLVRGRLDAVLLASRLAPLTTHIGLVPSVTATHTEPFHVAKAIATLDHVSSGRAGVRVQVSGRAHEAAHFGRRRFPEFDPRRPDAEQNRLLADLLEEAGDHIEVSRRLWDSWEDDAEIRDAATGRFIDRDRLHYVDFEGRFFSVRGPSITPRSPQGQPVVVVLAHSAQPLRLGAAAADVVLTTPRDTDDVADLARSLRRDQAEAGRSDATVHLFADLTVYLDDDSQVAHDRLSALDALVPAPESDSLVFVGTARELADVIEAWHEAGLTGVRVRPGSLPHDLLQVTRSLVPELQRRGVFRQRYEADSLRGLLGLPRPASRYAAV